MTHESLLFAATVATSIFLFCLGFCDTKTWREINTQDKYITYKKNTNTTTCLKSPRCLIHAIQIDKLQKPIERDWFFAVSLSKIKNKSKLFDKKGHSNNEIKFEFEVEKS